MSRFTQNMQRFLVCDSECGTLGGCGKSNAALGPAPEGWAETTEADFTEWEKGIPKGAKRSVLRRIKSALAALYPSGRLSGASCEFLDKANRWGLVPLDDAPGDVRFRYSLNGESVQVRVVVCSEITNPTLLLSSAGGRDFELQVPKSGAVGKRESP